MTIPSHKRAARGYIPAIDNWLFVNTVPNYSDPTSTRVIFMDFFGKSGTGRCVAILSITWAFLSVATDVGAAILSYKFEGYVYQLQLGADGSPPVSELFDGRFLVGQQITGFFSHDPSAFPPSGVPPNSLLKFIIGGTEFTGDTSSTYGGFLPAYPFPSLTYYSFIGDYGPDGNRRHVPITASPSLPDPEGYPPNIIFGFYPLEQYPPYLSHEEFLASGQWFGQLAFSWPPGTVYGKITSISRVPEPSTAIVSGLILLSMLCFSLNRCRAPRRDPQSRG